MTSNPSWIELGVRSTSVLSRTWIKNIKYLLITNATQACSTNYHNRIGVLKGNPSCAGCCNYFSLSKLYDCTTGEIMMGVNHFTHHWLRKVISQNCLNMLCLWVCKYTDLLLFLFFSFFINLQIIEFSSSVIAIHHKSNLSARMSGWFVVRILRSVRWWNSHIV